MSLVSPWCAAWLVALGLVHWALPPRHRRAVLGVAGAVFAVLVGG
jgi:hypothetical protein